MAKDKSFASKVAKSSQLTAKHCPKCGELQNMILVVESVKKTDKNSWGFKDNFVSYCKCNEKELF